MCGSAKRRLSPTPMTELVGQDHGHAMQGDATDRRRDAPNGAHERIDAGRGAFARDRPGDGAVIAGEAGDDSGEMQAPKRRPVPSTPRHCRPANSGTRRCANRGVRRRPGEFDEGVRRVRLDHAVGDDDFGTFVAAGGRAPSALTRNRIGPVGPMRGRTARKNERSRRVASSTASPRRPIKASAAIQRRSLVGGDGLEPPTLSV
jgi:hypothetical protein